MARIFTIQFDHEGTPCSALVSVRPTPFATEYTLSMLPEYIAGELPTTRILSAENGKFVFMNVEGGHPTPLMNRIISAIAGHVAATA